MFDVFTINIDDFLICISDALCSLWIIAYTFTWCKTMKRRQLTMSTAKAENVELYFGESMFKRENRHSIFFLNTSSTPVAWIRAYRSRKRGSVSPTLKYVHNTVTISVVLSIGH